MQVAESQTEQLAHTEPGRVEELEHRGVAQPPRLAAVGCREHALHLGEAEDLRQSAPDPRSVEVRRRVVRAGAFQDEVGEEASHRDQPARGRARRAPLDPHLAQHLQQLLAVDLLELGGPRKRAFQSLEVGPVGGDRVGGQPTLGDEVVEVARDPRTPLPFRPRLAACHEPPPGAGTSSRIVTGPWLTSSTSIIAWKTPVATSRPRSRSR